ncbi:MAG: tetratricopeptide repeat protein [Coriobacteriales bacterium]
MLNQDLLEQAKAAYDSGNYAGALRGYYTLLKEQKATFEPGEAGLVYHMLGNCLVKMRSFDDAEKAYKKALEDTEYENLTAVHSNYGLALTSTGEYRKAIEQFETVLKDPTYKTPYKTYSGLGNAYLQLGDYASAGTAYRNAAVDDRNPTPVKALLNLGVCFMGLNRPADAIETYRAIFEFNPDAEMRSKTYANMGQAFVAQGDNESAVAAFEKALEGDYELSEAAQADYLKASSGPAQAPVGDDRGVDVMGGYPGIDDFSHGYDPMDTRGGNEPFEAEATYGDGIPSAEDTGFFTLPDEGPDDLSVLLEQTNKRKPKRRGLRVLLTIIIIVLVLIIGGVALFWQGFGYPSQQATIEKLFDLNAAGEDATECWITPSSDEDKAKINKIMNSVAKTDKYTIDYLEKGMMESEALVTATLPDGGTIRYDISLSRDFSHIPGIIAWKVNGIEFAFPSTQNSLSSNGSDVTEGAEGDATAEATDAAADTAAGTTDTAADDAKTADAAAQVSDAAAETTSSASDSKAADEA